jgi:hypothetical protein
MNRSHLLTRFYLFRPLLSGILGIALMAPAFFFLSSLLARLCFGTKAAYYYVAPSFLQTPFDIFAFHKAQVILGCLILAALCNAKGRSWLNTAIVVQSLLLLLVLFVYTFIQHLRY